MRSTIPSTTAQTQRLLGDQKQIPQKDSRCKKGAIRTASVVLGVMGVGAGALYKGPSEQCALSEACGAWLSELTSEQFAQWTFFLTGAVGYGGTNAYFAANSVERFVEYMGKQKNTRDQLIKATAIALITGSQSILFYLLAASDPKTKANPLLLTLIMTGVIPAALYGTVNVVGASIPRGFSALKHSWRIAKLRYQKRRGKLLDSVELQRLEHYAQLQKVFIKKIQTALRGVRRDAQAVEVGNRDLLEVLTEYYLDFVPESWSMRMMRKLMVATGTTVAGFFSYPIIKNAYGEIGDFNPFLRLPLVLLLSVGTFYANAKQIINFFNGALEAVRSVILREPIQSMLFQLRMKTMLTIGALIYLTQAESYAVVCQKWDKQVSPELDAPKILALLGVCILHVKGLSDFVRARYQDFTPDKRAKLLLEIEGQVAKWEQMSIEEFIAFVETLDPGVRNRLSIPSANESSAAAPQGVTVETPKVVAPATATVPVESATVLAPRRPRRVSACEKLFGWTPFFSVSSADYDVSMNEVSSAQYHRQTNGQ